MTSNENTRFSRHIFRYGIGSILALGAGLVSFPITTRLLDNEQFGILSYLDTCALLLTAVLKFGCGDTLVRFYPHKGSEKELKQYWSSLLLAPALIALSIWAIVMAIAIYIALQGSMEMPETTLLALMQGILAVFFSHFLWVSRTKEQSKFNATIDVAYRWSIVAITVAILALVWPTADGVFLARVAGLAIFNIGIYVWLKKQIEFDISAIDWKYTWRGLRYGIPMALSEISSLVLGLVDRLMLKYLIGDYSIVGIYSIGFGLATYFDQLVTSVLGQAITPVASRLYSTQGAAAVVALKKTVLKNLVYLSGGFVCFLVFAGRDLLLTLAGTDKTESANIFVIAAIFFSVIPVLKVMAIGLLLDKRSDLHFIIILASAALNICINYVAIPKWGALGACFSTCSSLAVMNVALYILCPRQLRCHPSLIGTVRSIALAVACGVLMYWTEMFGVQQHWAKVLVALITVVIFYGGGILDSDSEFRKNIMLSLGLK
jgi:O-antigen/teichoic acid export membrane protein